MHFKNRRIFPLVILSICLMLSGCNHSMTWEDAQKANTYEAYLNYIEAYPDGEHTAEAQKLAESHYWSTIKSDTLAKPFQKYLNLFPNGSHKSKAVIMLSQSLSGGNVGTKARVTGSSVIIRSNYTTDSPSVGVVAKAGTIVQIIDWYSVGSNNGALLKQDITVINDGKRYELSSGKAVQVLSDLKDSVYVSFATTHDAAVEAIISKDVIKSMSGQMWYKIHTKDDITGWIYGEFIEVL